MEAILHLKVNIRQKNNNKQAIVFLNFYYYQFIIYLLLPNNNGRKKQTRYYNQLNSLDNSQGKMIESSFLCQNICISKTNNYIDFVLSGMRSA